MTTEYVLAIELSMHRFEIQCQNRTAMLRLAAVANERWQEALSAPEFRGIFQIQGDHGMISISPHVIQHIEPIVREDVPLRYDWSEPLPKREPEFYQRNSAFRKIAEDELYVWEPPAPKPRRSLLVRLLRRGR